MHGPFRVYKRKKEPRMEELATLEDAGAFLERHGDAPVLVFKHSTRCPISASALRRVEAWLAGKGDDAPPAARVLVVERRAVSNFLSERLDVPHASPQALICRRSRPVWHASHNRITAEALDDALSKEPLPGI